MYLEFQVLICHELDTWPIISSLICPLLNFYFLISNRRRKEGTGSQMKCGILKRSKWCHPDMSQNILHIKTYFHFNDKDSVWDKAQLEIKYFT